MDRVLIAEHDGVYKVFDAPVGDTTPHLTCSKDAAFITSVSLGTPGTVTVVEARCSAKGCESKRSDSIAIVGGHEPDAATLESGVVVVWKIKPDRVLSRAKGMAFFRLAALDKLAAAPPHPLIENRRGGGYDIENIHLIARPTAAIVAMDWGGNAPSTYAVRIDRAGTVSQIGVEETQW